MASHPSASDRRIRPLPAAAVAQIKSSTAIVSLRDAVLGLVANALDAGAAKIEATVDFARGGCVVEDNGWGIAPADFAEHGGLGKLHFTSKYYSDDASLGRNGAFLASLAAMSLLTVVSRHHEHRSHNSVTFHHSQPVHRELPTALHNQLHGKHGTRVSVRNLFGNLPVRIKQRSMAMQQKAEHDRQWDSLKHCVTALLLSARTAATIRLRDAENSAMLNISPARPTEPVRQSNTAAVKPHSTELRFICNVLTHAAYVSVEEWSAWVPASASTSALSIKGAISLDPAPSKRVQFISLGIRPLFSEGGHNELYDEVNRIFALSSFGTHEDDADVDEEEKFRRKSDNRFKADGYTKRQLKARKGVDRYPMFHLRIQLKDNQLQRPEERFLDDETNLQSVLNVLQAMLIQWLSVHHFRPQKCRLRRDQKSSASSAKLVSEQRENASTPGSQRSISSHAEKQTAANDGVAHNSIKPNHSKRKASFDNALIDSAKRVQHRAFAEWSRIKSGKTEFFGDTSLLAKRNKDIPLSRSNSDDKAPSQCESTNKVANLTLTTNLSQAVGGNEMDVGHDDTDEAMVWTDPVTKQTHLLNARTGCVMLQGLPRPRSDPVEPNTAYDASGCKRSLRLPEKPAGADGGKTPWLDGVLRTWENPIFKPVEQSIKQLSLYEPTGHAHSHHFNHSQAEIDRVLQELSTSSASKLSKSGLKNAQVLAQLDKKFILVKMKNCLPSTSAHQSTAELLVLIDQHAADERIRVEELLAELTPLPQNHAQAKYRSPLGHHPEVACTILEKPMPFTISLPERAQFEIHARRFASWGILYGFITSNTIKNSNMSSQQILLSVTALPAIVSERCRTDPKTLISFLRTTVWQFADETLHLSRISPIESESEQSPSWVTRLSSCPQGLVDLINSRACRSAIMFNDKLSLFECEQLVASLAECVFPFMCAHGRPSMVPLVNIGSVTDGRRSGLGDSEKSRTGNASGNGKTDFVSAWKRWQTKQTSGWHCSGRVF